MAQQWDDDFERDEEFAVEERRRTKRPRKWKVLLYNDDFTTMEFVVHVLTTHFHKPPAEATHIMLQIHRKGVGVAGVYTREVAETKAHQVVQFARENEMPLQASLRKSQEQG